MRWSYDGAEGLLHLRTVALNGDWNTYHLYRKQCRQQRLYNCDWPINNLDGPLTSFVSANRQSKPETVYEQRSPIDPRSNLNALPLAT